MDRKQVAEADSTGSSLPRDYVLLTGATGLVGQYLIKDLLMAGQRLALVVRPAKRLDIYQRLELILQRWEKELDQRLPRPIVLQGDVAEPNLGMNQADLDWVMARCGRVIHNAAILQFDGADRDGEPWRTNLGGTRNVLDLLDRMKPDELHYVSTAYVCGTRQELVKEDELDLGQGFRNDYERSKFESEQLVRAWEGGGSTTIYRPAVIVGDSQNGFTSTYHGLYMYLRLLATLVPEQKRNEQGVIETPIRLPMQGDEPRNLVPVDWVSAVMTRIFLDREAHGRTYQLVPDTFVTARKVIEAGYQYFNSAGVIFCGPSDVRPKDNEFSAKYFENVKMYESYETSDPDFDSTNLKKVVPDLKCPEITKEVILKFMEFGVRDRWGKRRPKPPTRSNLLESQSPLLLQAAEQVVKPEFCIGIDLLGPGGGQWTLRRESGRVALERGCPEAAVVLKLETASDSQSAGGPGVVTDSELANPSFWVDQVNRFLEAVDD